MARRSRAGVSEGQRVRFVCTSLLDEIGKVRETNSDGTSLIEIVEGRHAGGGGTYNNAEFVVAEEAPKAEAVDDDGDGD